MIHGLLTLGYSLFRGNPRRGKPLNHYHRFIRILTSRPKSKPIISLVAGMGALVITLAPKDILAQHQPGNPQDIQTPQPIIETEHFHFNFPVPGGRLTQKFHLFHPAIDLAAPYGQPVFPIASGKVIEVYSSLWGLGKTIEVQHTNNLTSKYCHLSKITVNEGQEVSETTSIGTVGATGWATGPHLHLEVRKDGQALNPLEFLEL
jgi:murein DD-endopeptidase MepM/ murein hydrolase activator NlpD